MVDLSVKWGGGGWETLRNRGILVMGDDFEMGRLISLYRHKLKADKTQ